MFKLLWSSLTAYGSTVFAATKKKQTWYVDIRRSTNQKLRYNFHCMIYKSLWHYWSGLFVNYCPEQWWCILRELTHTLSQTEGEIFPNASSKCIALIVCGMPPMEFCGDDTDVPSWAAVFAASNFLNFSSTAAMAASLIWNLDKKWYRIKGCNQGVFSQTQFLRFWTFTSFAEHDLETTSAWKGVM